ncbi:MAG TPA: hypothetical protein VIB49_01695 [Thermoplasmata archaeon]|jgi:uncharacterized protein YhaN
MDPSGVLLALEEQKKWRGRKERLRQRITQLDRRRLYLEKELGRTRKKMAECRDLLSGQASLPALQRPVTPTPPPIR